MVQLAEAAPGAQIDALDIGVVVVYLFIVGYLGWLGFRRTKTAADYMVAGRKVHPFVMAMSYGATFISTSAIVGFGGVAGLFGMSVLWLTFLNIFVGIFIAFVFLGGPTRRLGHRLDAHTFPELMGRRYQSRTLQVIAGLIVALFIPLYAAAVLIGAAKFLQVQFFPAVEGGYEIALLIFSIIIALYVVVGGLKGVMYTDALQGTIMFVGMLILLVATYVVLGGVTPAHEQLTNLKALVPGKLATIGHKGWTAMPPFGWGDIQHNLWWIVISTITLGVGIGVLAQPQLVVRFMTVKSRKELNRAVLVGGIFILIMTGVAFTVGSLSNAWFAENGPVLQGRLVKPLDEAKNQHVLQLMAKGEDGTWTDVEGKMAPVVLDPEEPYLDETTAGGERIARGRSISIVYAKGEVAQIIPLYIKKAMGSLLGRWFGLLFMLTLLAAAMSTLSSQFHALGTSLGRDVFETVATRSHSRQHRHSVTVVRVGICLGILAAIVIGLYSKQMEYIIARATAIFFGLCASAFLPTFVGGLFWRRMTRAGALCSMIAGFLVTAFWLVFVKAQEAEAIGIVKLVTDGKTSILEGHHNWPVVDPIVVALPVSILVAVVVSLMTKPPEPAHLETCFGKQDAVG